MSRSCRAEEGRARGFILTSFESSSWPTRTTAIAHRNAAAGTCCALEISSGEERYQRDPAHDETPERIFERRWALSVLDRVVDRLRD